MALFKPDKWNIKEFTGEISKGDIKLPAFQRGFVWKQWQVLDLLDSIYKDYPIGSILLWYSKERLKSTKSILGFPLPEKPSDNAIHYVLDGQQRLSTIYGVFSASDNKPAMFDIYFDLNECRFLSKESLPPLPDNLSLFPKEKDKFTNNYPYLNLDNIFDISKFFKAEHEQSLNAQQIKVAEQLITQFQGYEIPVIIVKERAKEDIGIIFQRINSKVTELDTLDLANAWTWSEGFHLREIIEDIKELIGDKGFEDIELKIILQCLSAIINEKTDTKYIIEPDPIKVKTNITILQNSLERAIDFLSIQFKVISDDFLPHAQQIVPLTYFFSRVKRPAPQQTKLLTQWFWRTSFSRRYAGQTDQKMNDDISFFNEIISDKFTGIGKYTIDLDKEALINQELNKTHPYTRAYSLLLAQKGPLNLIDGIPIDLGRPLSAYNQKELHHIFPKDFLKSQKINTPPINSLCNICFLPSETNKRISNRPPSDYMFQGGGLFDNHSGLHKDKFIEVLESNLMPTDLAIYQKNLYKQFIEHRAEIILQYLNKLIS